ncbi:MAG: hypothetical protein JWQ14_2468 [Adhaeribacter sp.]|nr:hypothetical protein [Adhaeribacter sp.]
MKIQAIVMVLLTFLFMASCSFENQKQKQADARPVIQFVNQEADKKVDVMIDGKLFTSYWWPDTVMKPVLYPVFTSSGTEITRGYPIKARPGERADHPHHVGIWLNYGNVNGYDFWGNSFAIPAEKRKTSCGKVKHLRVEELAGGSGEGTLITAESWIDPVGKELLAEKTEYHFIAQGPTRIIDRVTTLTATGEAVAMKDTKEGMFGIRVARQLELPSQEEVTLTDAKGNPETVKKITNEGVSGSYKSSKGVTDEAVWGTRAKWLNLTGNIGDEKISLVISDHPKNLSYPTYWHARGYGLFCANPFGWKDFTKGKEELNYTIPAGKSITFRYRVIVNSGAHLTDDQINDFAADFAKKYQ